jgi:MoxR-like ATPase
MWQERCQKVLREAGRTGAILHLGNLMELLQVGKGEYQSQGLASFLRPWLARGELLAVAECTPEQLPLIERHDPHLARAFVHLRVEEPGPEKLQAILNRFAQHHGGAPLTADGSDEILRLHRRYATYSANPGRPLRFLRNLLADQPRDKPITAATVTAGFSRETGLPRVLLEESVPLDLAEARQWFAARVIGQAEAVDLVVDLLATVKPVLNRPRKPIASLLFIGPTGVGKTEMAKALAAFLFGNPTRLTRFDMSEYSDPLAVQRLIGGAGTSEGLLTARVREQPFAVILLDEVEKADPQLFDLLLQVLGEGRLTDAAGRLADFCNSVVIMTSNLGAETYLQGQFGFVPGERGSVSSPVARLEARQHFVTEVRKAVRPELFNRIDRIVPFAPLDEETTRLIAQRQLDLVRRRDGIRYRGVTLELDDQLPTWLARIGYDPRYGARPLKRAIERQLLAPLATRMNDYTATTALRVQAGVKGDLVLVQVRARTDSSGQQMTVSGIGQAERDIAESCQALRRALQTLQNCSAFLEVINEIYRLERMARREFYHTDLEELRRLRDVVQAQTDSARAREDEALLELYRDGGSQPGRLEHLRQPLTEAQGRFDQIVMDLYLRQFSQANQVTLSVFSEDAETLVMLAAAYFQTAQSVRSVSLYQFLPAARQGGVAAGVPVRIGDVTYHYLPPAQPGEPLAVRRVTEAALLFEPDRLDRWKGVIGAALEIGGKAVYARYVGEAGLHVLQTPRQTTRALICTSEEGINSHHPPEGIERRGAIGNQQRRRTYRLEAGLLDDERLGSRALPGRTVAESLPAILDDTLWLAARSILEP